MYLGPEIKKQMLLKLVAAQKQLSINFFMSSLYDNSESTKQFSTLWIISDNVTKICLLFCSKKEKNCYGFFFEITKFFLTRDLPQNKFHKKLRKIIINFHSKIMYENIVETDMNKF